jgi:hypothetical protein
MIGLFGRDYGLILKSCRETMVTGIDYVATGYALLIAATILAARKLSQYEAKMVPATVAAISDGVRWAEEILKEIDRKHPAKG